MKQEYADVKTDRRIVLADAYIFAQFNLDTEPGDEPMWYTMRKSAHNDESDFAMWPYSEDNLLKARVLAGDCPIINAPLEYRVKRHGMTGRWYVHRGDTVDEKAYDSHNVSLRNLARSIE